MKAHKSTKPKTSTQVRQEFANRGESVAGFARRHALSVGTVRQVLSGRSRGCRGEAHRAAVLLGMKIGIIDSSTGH